MNEGFWAVGKSGVDKIRKMMMDAGLPMNPETPDIVITFGGDGTMLRANRDFPDSKILPVVHESFGGAADLNPARVENIENVLEKLRREEYSVENRMNVEVQYKNFKTTALNEVVIYRDDEKCNRMRIVSEGKDLYGVELIGDGIIASTSTGSSGYCRCADGIILKETERIFEITPMYSQYKGDEIINYRRVPTNVRESKLLPEGKEVIITYSRDIRNKIVPDSLQDERQYFDFKSGDYVTVRAAKKDTKFVKLLP